ncbi:MAG: helix-turn-helix transcriptional regulator [Marinilabiliales bacterium]
MIKDRIEQIIRDEGITSSKFADEIGVQRSSISHTMSGRNKPSLDLIMKILERYRYINAEWLLFGRGRPYKTEQQDISDLFSKNEHKNMNENILSSNPDSDVTERNDNIYKASVNDSVSENIENNEGSSLTKVKQVKHITRMIIFYDDNTFEELVPKP